MHPTHTAYWIMASQWESEGDRKGMGGGNTEAARKLCMRALRFLKGKGTKTEGKEGEEEAVWREWIRVEVAFVERLRARAKVLGVGSGKTEDIVRVKEKKADEEEEEAEEDEGVAVPVLEGEVADEEETLDPKVLSGQEAILGGAIVRVVIDNLLKCTFPFSSPSLFALTFLSAAYSHSIFAYKLLLSILRPLPSPLRLPLLLHVYTSLSANVISTLPSYPAALHILATRHLYDVPFSPPKTSKKRKAEEAEVAEPEDPNEVKVQGEKLVDAVGKATEEYWKVLKGLGKKAKKGKGKESEGGVAAQAIYEQFAAWLEGLAEETDDKDLVRSPFLACLRSSAHRFLHSSSSLRPTSLPFSSPPLPTPSFPSSTSANCFALKHLPPPSSPSLRR